MKKYLSENRITKDSLKYLADFIEDKNFKIIDLLNNLLEDIDLISICNFCSHYNIYLKLSDNNINIKDYINIYNQNINGWSRVIIFSENEVDFFNFCIENDMDMDIVDRLNEFNVDLLDFNLSILSFHKDFYEFYKKTNEKVYFKEIYKIENLDEMISSSKEILENSNSSDNDDPIKILNIPLKLSKKFIGFENNLENDKEIYQLVRSSSSYIYDGYKNTTFKNTIKFLQNYYFNMTTFDAELKIWYGFEKIFNKKMVIIQSRIASLYSILISKYKDNLKRNPKFNELLFDLFFELFNYKEKSIELFRSFISSIHEINTNYKESQTLLNYIFSILDLPIKSSGLVDTGFYGDLYNNTRNEVISLSKYESSIYFNNNKIDLTNYKNSIRFITESLIDLEDLSGEGVNFWYQPSKILSKKIFNSIVKLASLYSLTIVTDIKEK